MSKNIILIIILLVLVFVIAAVGLFDLGPKGQEGNNSAEGSFESL